MKVLNPAFYGGQEQPKKSEIKTKEKKDSSNKEELSEIKTDKIIKEPKKKETNISTQKTNQIKEEPFVDYGTNKMKQKFDVQGPSPKRKVTTKSSEHFEKEKKTVSNIL